MAAAATVLATGRLGRRLGTALAGWVQCTLLLAIVYSQYLLCDPLMTAGIWLAVLAWAEGALALAALAAAVAFLAKGPPAALFLVPLLWATAPLRSDARGALGSDARGALGSIVRSTLGRGLAVLLLGLAPLAAWGALAAHEGGEAVRRGLLWGRWGGRIHDSLAHPQPFWFYVPILPDLMRRVFGIDVLRCGRCRSRRRLVSIISERSVIVRFLAHLGLETDPPPVQAARAPPQLELAF